MIRSIFTLCVFISTLFISAYAGEWNQHRGPFSNNQSDESITSANWLKASSSIDWKVDTPLGFSSFTIYDGSAYTLVAEAD